jgi:hypothetical protein
METYGSVPLAVVLAMLALAGSREKTRALGFRAADALCVDLHCLVVGERVEVSRKRVRGREREDTCLAQASLQPSTGFSFKLRKEAVGRWQCTSCYGEGVEAEFIECLVGHPAKSFIHIHTIHPSAFQIIQWLGLHY